METQNENYVHNDNLDLKEPIESGQSHDTSSDKSDIIGGPSAEDIENSTTDDGITGYADVDSLLEDTDGPGDDDDELDDDELDDDDLDDDDFNDDPDAIEGADDTDLIDNDLNTDDLDFDDDDDDDDLIDDDHI